MTEFNVLAIYGHMDREPWREPQGATPNPQRQHFQEWNAAIGTPDHILQSLLSHRPKFASNSSGSNIE